LSEKEIWLIKQEKLAEEILICVPCSENSTSSGSSARNSATHEIKILRLRQACQKTATKKPAYTLRIQFQI
jgi:hypothetical protein